MRPRCAAACARTAGRSRPGPRCARGRARRGCGRRARFCALGRPLGDGAVGEQHELLDEPVGRLALLGHDLDRHALGVEADAHLGHVEVDGALAHPLRREDLGEPARAADLVGEGVGRDADRALGQRAVEHGLRALVGEAVDRVDDRLADPVALTSPSGSTVMRHEYVSLSSRGRSEQTPFESASGSIGMTRSTRYVLVAAGVGLVVQRRARADVVAHVGDVDADLGRGPAPRSRVWMASSKSLASSGSMVKTGAPRRSSRRATSSRVMPASMPRRLGSTPSGSPSGRRCAIASASTSTPGASARPRTERTRPSGAALRVVEAVDATRRPCRPPWRRSSRRGRRRRRA